MIRLKTSSVRDFQKYASQIQPNTLLPVLSNLKIQQRLITKNSLTAAVAGQVETEQGDDETYLVDERILFALANGTKSEWIEIYNEANQTVLKDEVGLTQLPVIPVADFPALPDFDRNAACTLLTPQHIAAINIARQYINDSETAGAFQFVHMEAENIFAVHTNYFYINGGFRDLPSAAFRSNEAAMIVQHEKIEFLDLPNHHVFFTPGYDYVFTKSESGRIAISSILTRLALPGKNFTCSTEELLNFIQYANSVSESPVATCTLNAAGLFVKLQINDSNYNRGHERMIVCTGEPDEFTFNSRLVVSPMKAIPHATLAAKTNQNCLIVQQDAEWFCFVGMSKN